MNDDYTEVPYHMLSDEALRGVIQEFVLREGTDYSHQDWGMEKKVDQVLNQIKIKQAVILFDHRLESCTISLKN